MTVPTEFPDPTTALRFADVCVSYGNTDVLNRLDLTIGAHEKVSIIGPSGSGKTTVLRAAMTLVRPTSGNIEVFGQNLYQEERNGTFRSAREKHVRHVARSMGMVFQSYNLFPHMSVLQNVIEAPVSVLGLTKDAAVDRAERLLDMVGLRHKSDAYPPQLSGGQQQRIAIARAMALQPKIMLFDEITSALDPELVGEVLDTVRTLAEETPMAMVLVTHEMRFAREISDRVAVFDGGRVIEHGAPEQIFEAPSEPRTQQFLRAVLG